MTGAERRLLAGTARRFGVELDEAHLESLGIYLDELFSWNRRVNMTGLKSRDRMLVELIADSVIPVPRLPESGFFLDVGTGPGIPGIPIKILRPGLSAELLEPRGRMNTFLRHVIRLLALQEIRPLRGRIEKDKDLLRSEGYSVITARAVAGLAKTLEWCAPHLAPGGVFVGFAGKQGGVELEQSLEVMDRHALTVEKTLSYTLPHLHGERLTIFFRKQKKGDGCGVTS